MNPNISIYKRLNPSLLVQVGLGLGLLHWANICLIYISNIYLWFMVGWVSFRAIWNGVNKMRGALIVCEE